MKPTKGERFLEAFNDIDDKYLKEAMNYTMKKRFNFKPIIAVAACAALALAAVPVAKHFAGNPLGTQGTTVTTEAPSPIVLGNKFTAFYAGGSDNNSSSIIIEKETDFDGISTKFTDKAKSGTTYTVAIDGVTYTGTYVNSTKSDYYRDDTDNYEVRINNKIVTFSINRETGICRMFYVAGEQSLGRELSQDECYEKAFAYAKKYIDDIDNYQLIANNKRAPGYGYKFVWQRIINGKGTSDVFSIAIKENGEIYDYVLQSIGSFKNTDISRVNNQEVENTLEKKVINTYSNYSDITFSTTRVTLTRLANGKYAFVYDVSVSGTNEGKAFTNFDKIVVEVE